MSLFSRFAFVMSTAALLGVGPASAVSLDSLVKNSPFGGTGTAAGPGAAPSTLEFRGMYAEGGVNYYSIYNTETKLSSWVAEGEAPSVNVPVVIKGFEAGTELVQLETFAVCVKAVGQGPAVLDGHLTDIGPRRVELHRRVGLIEVVIRRDAVVDGVVQRRTHGAGLCHGGVSGSRSRLRQLLASVPQAGSSPWLRPQAGWW